MHEFNKHKIAVFQGWLSGAETCNSLMLVVNYIGWFVCFLVHLLVDIVKLRNARYA